MFLVSLKQSQEERRMNSMKTVCDFVKGDYVDMSMETKMSFSVVALVLVDLSRGLDITTIFYAGEV